MLKWHCMQRIKLDRIHWRFKVNKIWCYSPVRVFIFCVLHKVPTHLSFQWLFLCIFTLIPLLIQVLMSQRLLIASSVGINLTVYNFRACFFLNSFSTRNAVFITSPLNVAPIQTNIFSGTLPSHIYHVTYIYDIDSGCGTFCTQ